MLVWPSSQRTRKHGGSSRSTSSTTPLRPGWATRSDSRTITSPGCASILSHFPTLLGPIKRCIPGASDRRVALARRKQFSFGLESRAGTSLQDRPHDDR